LPRANFNPAEFSTSGKICRVKWANTSTFQKMRSRKSQQNRGKQWFTPAQRKVNKRYSAEF